MPSFSEMVRTAREGSLDADLSELMREAVLAVTSEGIKKTSVTFTVMIEEREGKDNKGAIDTTFKYSAKIPRQTVGSAIFYADDEGNLHRRNPNQEDMFDTGPRGVVPNHRTISDEEAAASA